MRAPRATLSYPFPWQFEAGKYQAFYLLSEVPESNVQEAILGLLHSFKVDAIAVDAGAKELRRTLAARMRRIGLAPATIGNLLSGGLGGEIPAGHSDIVGTLAPSGRSLYIEVKRPARIDSHGTIVARPGEIDREQLDFLLAKYKRGSIVMIAYSVDDVSEFLGDELRRNYEAMRSEAM